ncbi:MAG: hypothetical protein IJ817_02675 [Clostridia bacterium]|nr:hypothetical protein [Clostridia bacterium]
MWELSISVDATKIDVARFVYQTLKAQTEEFGGVVTCYEEFSKIFVLVACPIEEKGRVSVFVERCIIKAICNFYKRDFLTTNLSLPMHENMSMTAFTKALINFDKETDFYIISKNLTLDKNLYLDSFYNFKLMVLREKWGELVSLANENSDYLVSTDAFFDLLKFLIDNLEVGQDEIDVFEDENGYSISPIEDSKDLQCEKLSDEGLVSSLIDICPKKINLFCKSDDKAVTFLRSIFDERVNVCYNKQIERIDNLSFMK